ncbi:MAG: phytanoyl-CoA dioxygenase family protein, partial [Myxococcota bacterium]|nr:phytanoyl-CoA dioxygenase family protein [Myxococcota bacterium]
GALINALRPFVDATACLDTPSRLRALAARHGHLYLPGLLPPAAVEPIRREALDAVFDLGLLADQTGPRWRRGARLEGTGYDDPRWLALQQRLGARPQLRALSEHPALLALLEGLYGVPAAPHRGDLCRLSMPDAPDLTTPPHQDHHYLGGSTDIWTAWTPLDPCPLDLGPLAVWDGSHRSGYRPHAGQGAGRQQVDVPVDTVWSSGPLAVGDVVLFHCMTVHRALPNRTLDTVRLSVDLRYQPADQPIDTVRVDGTRPVPVG